MVWKRSDWNAIIDETNAVITSPPADTDCEPLPALEHVGPGTIWGKSHIRAVQDALKATCPSISFGPIPNLWRQSILDEINDAINQAWCECEPECDMDALAGLHGTRFELMTLPMVFRIGCLGNLPAPTTFLSNLIHGMQIAPAGFQGLLWRLLANQTPGNVFDYAEHANDVGFNLFGLAQTDLRFIAGGNVDCEGKVVVSGTGPLMPLSGGTNFVNCGNCASESCAEGIAGGQENVASAVPIIYVLELFVTGGASCC